MTISKLVAAIRKALIGNALLQTPGDLDILRMNVKNLAYDLARERERGLAAIEVAGEPRTYGLVSKATTQQDIETPWFVYWCSRLKIAPSFNRKLWEFAFLLQNLHERGLLEPGRSGLGFGCGEEPIPSFLASLGVEVTVTDLDPAKAKGMGWIETGQHTSALDAAYKPDLVAREEFDRRARLEFVDMNDVPSSLDGKYDFCWSICALEHLGSIEHGMRFVERAMRTLKPGGVAVHTTEFNYTSDSETLDHAPTVLFTKRNFTELRARLEAAGHEVGALDFDTGNGVLDRFIDMPPFEWDGLDPKVWGHFPRLKMALERFPSTCFALVVRRGG